MPGGRPKKFTPAIGVRFCNRIATSTDSLRKICKDKNIALSVDVFMMELLINPEGEFAKQYVRAKELQQELVMEEIRQISDTTKKGVKTKKGVSVKQGAFEEIEEFDMIEHRKLQIETRKWLASKLAAKKYGNKLDLTTGGEKISVDKLSATDLNALLSLQKKAEGK